MIQNEEIEYLRNKLDLQDDLLFTSLNGRFYFAKEIGKIKKKENLPIEDKDRYDELVNKMVEKWKNSNNYLSEEFIRKIYDLIHEESRRIQDI